VETGARADLVERRRLAAHAIRRRLVAHIAAGGTTDFAPTPMEYRADRYTDPDRAALEVRELFLKLPLIACLSQDIPQLGDRILFEALGRSIIVVRGADGRVRAFQNMCAHRGAKLVRPEADGRCGRRNRITCPFHAWSYGLDGMLIATPGPEGFPGMDLRQRDLIPAPATEWNGVVFVRMSGDSPIDSADYLGAFAPVIEQLELVDAAPVQSSALTAATNWKYALDTYGEGYHFGVLHASTIGGTHFCNVSVFDAFGPHWRLNFPERSLADLVGQPESAWPDAGYDGTHFVFPNTIMVVGALGPEQSFVRMFRIFPGATPGEMTCRFSVHSRGVDPEAFRARFAGVDDSESEVTHEDYRIAVEAHANLAQVRAGFRLVFGRNEPAVQAFHRSIAEAIGAPL
jgi:nitrite reductase/ring-hydroxylating ferredoxin subunit